jgi:hypothetical protein
MDIGAAFSLLPAIVDKGGGSALVAVGPTLVSGLSIQTVLDLHKAGRLTAFVDACATLVKIGDALLADPAHAPQVTALLLSLGKPAA